MNLNSYDEFLADEFLDVEQVDDKAGPIERSLRDRLGKMEVCDMHECLHRHYGFGWCIKNAPGCPKVKAAKGEA